MEQTELLALITESQTGDRKAQEQLVLCAQNRIYYHCLKILRNESDAMDASQDILISMLTGLKTLRDPDAFWAWLNQITCRTCCRRLARQRRQTRLLAAEAADALLDGNLDDQSVPDRLLDNEENRRIIGELVDSLPEMQRLCVLMYYYDEMSIKDIAAAMETSEGTVKSRLHYARQHIKKEVERYSSQGFALYGVSPLPFLSYFLQQEAAQTCLSAASAKALGEAVLAAGAAAGAAAGGAAAAGSTAAMAGSARAALALAGLLLVGAVAGGALLHRPKSPEPEPVQAIPQDVPVRNEPSAPAIPAQPEPVVSEPAAQTAQTDDPQPEPSAAVRLSPTPQPVLSIPAPELPSAPQDPAPTESPSPQPSLWTFSTPDILPEPINFFVPLPSEPEPEPEPEPERKPEANPVYVPPSQRPEYVPPAPPPAQDPESDPNPEPTVINQDLSDYGHDSGYGYIASFADQWDGELPENLTYTSSDSSVVGIDSEGNFITLSKGTAVLTAVDPNDASFQYTLTVTVRDHFQWDYHIMDAELITGESTNWTFTSYAAWDTIQSSEWLSDATDVVRAGNAPYVGGCHLDAIAPGTATVTGRVTFHVDASDGTHVLQDTFSFQVTVKDPPEVEEASVSILADGQPYEISQFFSDHPFAYAESSDPGVVSVDNGRLIGLAPGTADVNCYTEYTGSEIWHLAAILHITVEPAEPEPEPEPGPAPEPEPEPKPDPEPDPGDFHQRLPRFGLNSGYGYVAQFAEWWKGPLPETLEYESSDPSIVYIDSQGNFCTLAPGPATLTAFDPGNPDCKYILDIQVQNCFQWEHAVSSKTAYIGRGVTCCLYGLGWLSNLKSASIQWTSRAPGIADIDPSYYLMKWYDIRIIGVSLGTTTFTGDVTFQVETPLGIIEMHDTVTMEVTVIE